MPRPKRTTDVAKMTDNELQRRFDTLQESIDHTAVAGQLQRMNDLIEEQMAVDDEIRKRATEEARKADAARSAQEKAATIRAEAERKAGIAANVARVHEISARRADRDSRILGAIDQLGALLAAEAADQEAQRIAIAEVGRGKHIPFSYPLPGVGRSNVEKLIVAALARAGLVRSPIGRPAPDALTLDEAHERDDSYLRPRLAALAAWQPKPETSWVDAHVARTNQRLATERKRADEQMSIAVEEDRQRKERDLERSRNIKAVDHGGPGGSIRIVPQEQSSESI